MLERLLELFFHAKSGVFAGIFLIGTTGALVTATVSNGVATITITQASASPSASASASASAGVTATASPTSSATASPTVSPSGSPSSSPSSTSAANNCSEQAHEINLAVKTVDTAFSQFHTDLMRMKDNRSSDAKDIVENADKLLKSLRQNAVKAIHATKTCAGAKDEDEDEDQDEDEDNDDERSSKREGNFIVVLFSNLQNFFGSNTSTVNTTTASPAPGTASDPMTIAEDAVAAMQLVFDEAKAQLDDLPTPSPRATKSPKPTADSNRGKGHGKND